jgi:hypothetical protein
MLTEEVSYVGEAANGKKFLCVKAFKGANMKLVLSTSVQENLKNLLSSTLEGLTKTLEMVEGADVDDTVGDMIPEELAVSLEEACAPLKEIKMEDPEAAPAGATPEDPNKDAAACTPEDKAAAEALAKMAEEPVKEEAAKEEPAKEEAPKEGAPVAKSFSMKDLEAVAAKAAKAAAEEVRKTFKAAPVRTEGVSQSRPQGAQPNKYSNPDSMFDVSDLSDPNWLNS